jgi:hypothetical protein
MAARGDAHRLVEADKRIAKIWIRKRGQTAAAESWRVRCNAN